VGLAFDLSEAASRDGLARLRTLPPASAYLSNMAADPKLRRNGVARAMLRGCDAAAAGCSAGVGARSEVWLHVREGDEAARALYAGFGYEEVEREAQQGGGLLGFGFGGAPRRGRILMRWRVSAPE
jgi:ribosomal protein S18 acetylase RimI-like enzyme